LAGLWVLRRSRTRSPRLSRALKNSGFERVPAAAAATWRYSVTRASPGRPGRAAFSCSGRLFLLGPGHHLQAVVGLDIAQGLANAVIVVVQPARRPSIRASVATM